MCGICGKLNFEASQPVSPALIRDMMSVIRHRGPDEDGTHFSSNVGLGHLRLNIIDLSTGKQPISNEDGSVWIIFNGEIYNYKELRSFLVDKGHTFRTATDTEVIVHLYEELGEAAIEKLWGMFSFAIWDNRKKTLLIARDRVGIKPLYYCQTPKALIFSSEIKAILRDPSVRAEMDPAQLDTFLTYLYVPGAETLFKGISKLLPGHYMIARGGKVRIEKYWDLSFEGKKRSGSEADFERDLVDLLAETVRGHMIADVPVGVLLSGGVDSTAMLSFATEQTGKQISSFTIGFEGKQFADERPYAQLAADRYKARHFEMTITAQDFEDCLPRYVWHMEEPVCEPPAIALYYVTKLAREHVTVLLSGEGGDEAFAGYQNYRNIYWLEKIKRALGPAAWPSGMAAGALGHVPGFTRLGKYAPLMKLPFEDYYFSRTSGPFELFNTMKGQLYTAGFRSSLPVNGHSPKTLGRHYAGETSRMDVLDRMLFIDTKSWLPDDLLIKADKITMANSLELRVPLLDHRVLEFAASLPRTAKLHGLTTKYVLKRALANRIPEKILNRKKTGFPVPYESWIQGEMRNYVRDVLTDKRTLERGYFQREGVESILKDNSMGTNRAKEIFSLVVLELWHRMFIDGESMVSEPLTAAYSQPVAK
jgi:asparagine synthase (glutamine-hydrolysing)